MGALKLSLGALLFVLLVAVAQAGKNFWLFRQYILQQEEEQAIKEISFRLRLLAQRPGPISWNSPIESIIRQPLDHFNRQNPLTFNQRFWINEGFWLPGGPVFLYIGGESALSKFAVLSGHHVEMAEKYGALLLALEHRFYGASLNPDGLEDSNLLYLSSQQALSDLASFHLFITQKYNLTSTNTWICFGGSYPGSLAAWFRLKFPHLVFAAVSSSAPVRAQLDFKGYNKVVAESLSNPVVGGSQKCHEAVAEAFSTLDGLIRNEQMEKLAKDFRSCGALKEAGDFVELVGNLASIFMGVVQYNDKAVEWASVAGLCGIMTNSTGSPYQKLMVINNVFLDNLKQPCLDNSHEKMLEELRSTNLSLTGPGFRPWFFQTCTEFGYYQTCEDSTCLFSRLLSLRSLADTCTEVFNISLNWLPEAVDFTNEYYGADHPKASRVLFVNGDIDPWHVLSVLKNQSRSELALLINGTSHCANMKPSRPTDPLPLVHARKLISTQVGEWLELAQTITGGH